MKKFTTLLCAALMFVSVVFVSTTAVPAGPLSIHPSSGQVTVKRRKPGIARRTYRGGRWVVRRTWDGTKWVTKKVWVGTKWTGRKSWRTGRKVVSRTKKIVY